MPLFQVTTGLDVIDDGDGLLSLREAIIGANDAPGKDVITFAPNVDTVTLDSSLPPITESLSVIALPGSPVTIEATFESAFQITGADGDYSFFNIGYAGLGSFLSVGGTGNEVTLTQFTHVVQQTLGSDLISLDGLENRLDIVASSFGPTDSDAVIDVDGDQASLDLRYSSIDMDNRGNGTEGIELDGSTIELSISSSILRGDDGTNEGIVDGDINDNLTLTISNSVFADNVGPALTLDVASSAIVSIINSTFRNNGTGLRIVNGDDVDLTISGSRFINNTTGLLLEDVGDIDFTGTVDGSRFANNDTGIQNNSPTEVIAVSDSEFINNQDNFGGIGTILV